MITLTEKEARLIIKTIQEMNETIKFEYNEDSEQATVDECIRILQDGITEADKNTIKVPKMATVWRTPIPEHIHETQDVRFTYQDKERGYKHVIINEQIFTFEFV